MKLLIVEDEAKLADYLRKGLAEEGYVVEVASNGVDGLHMATEGSHDAAVAESWSSTASHGEGHDGGLHGESDEGGVIATTAGGDSAYEHRHEVVDGGWSVGSAAPIEDGCMPLGHPVKGVYALGIYQVPGSDWYDATTADVWFTDENAAQRAGFRRGEG